VINGLYSSAAGMLGQMEMQDAISNNLANTNTPGFKRSTIGFSTALADADQQIVLSTRRDAGCVIPVVYESKDNSTGMIADNSDPTSLAIDGPGFFVVGSANNPQYTRSGNFKLDDKGSGLLITQDGEPVLGQRGPIKVSGNNWAVDHDGSVRVAGKVVDKLRIERTNGKTTGRVLQGRLEGSNVNAVQEMVAMISGLRAYEASQKAIQNLDQTLDKVINTAGRTG
jgi:flagellar basal-body rod protein FlgF